MATCNYAVCTVHVHAQTGTANSIFYDLKFAFICFLLCIDSSSPVSLEVEVDVDPYVDEQIEEEESDWWWFW